MRCLASFQRSLAIFGALAILCLSPLGGMNLVLCMGGDDHIAVETPHLDRCESPARNSSKMTESLAHAESCHSCPGTQACVDVPILTDTVNTDTRQMFRALTHSVAATTFQAVPVDTTRDLRGEVPASEELLRNAFLRSPTETVVLII